MLGLRRILSEIGICQFRPLISSVEIEKINALLDPLFESRQHERRSYVTVDEIQSLGLFDVFLKTEIQDIFIAALLKPVLYHFHIYETAACDNQPHIFSETLSGWHRDMDSDYLPGDPTHISLFIYLSEVGPEDGPFEFLPKHPTHIMAGGAATISVLGQPGHSFVWDRNFYHRAAPNRGSKRRRLLKISAQHQRYPSIHLARESFRNLQAAVVPGDKRMDMFLGRPDGGDLTFPEVVAPEFFLMQPNSTMNVLTSKLLKAQIKGKLNKIKKVLLSDGKLGIKQEIAYD